MRSILPLYLIAFVAANLIVNYFGPYGLWFSSFFLIPFDFIVRCLIHERYSGLRLFLVLFSLTCIAALITFLINRNAMSIALGSVCGFSFAQLGAGIFYQAFKKKSYFIKANGSDLVGIVCDSIIFQFVAFHALNPGVTFGQVVIKFCGGLLWYLILFKKLKLHEKINRDRA